MSLLQTEGKSIERNPKGFLNNFEDWNENVARQIAAEENLELGECHWAAIRFIREYYEKNEIPPSPKVLIREVGDQLHAYKCTYSTLKGLFPKGGCKQACRIAGLPEYFCISC